MSDRALSTLASTAQKRKIFLRELADSGNVKRSCRIAGIDHGSAYRDRHNNEEFAEAWAEAKAIADKRNGEELEKAALKRAKKGRKEKVYYQGQVVDVKRVPSDVLAIFMLKGLMPEKYGDKVNVKHSGKVNVLIDIGTGSPAPPTIEGAAKDITPDDQAA